MKDAAGNVLTSRTATWASDNTAVATVSGAGLVTGVAPGSATITATSEGKSGTAAITTASPPQPPQPVTSVTITPSTISLTVGETHQLTAVLRDAAGNELSGRAVAWGTSDAAVVTVSSSGLVSALSAGSATIAGTSEGQEGTATVSVAPIPTNSFVTVATGGAHSCALTSAGAAYCWGRDESGQLGAPATSSCPLDDVKAGGFIGHTCGFTDAGTAYCWGENERGQVGDGSTTDRLSPSPVSGGLSFTSLDAGFRHTCARATSGTLYCWGSGGAGQLGTNSTTQSNVPARFSDSHELPSSTLAGGLSSELAHLLPCYPPVKEIDS